jgi:hypothetical protein
VKNYISNGAIFSPDRDYRYILWRRWSKGKTINFILLNPSTADEKNNDPTVERCEQRARMWGYGELVVTNIFAYRSTNPKVLSKMHDPVGPDNDKSIFDSAVNSNCTICGWGEHGKLLNRGNVVKKLLCCVKLYALRINKSGIPSHPLYLSYKLKPISFTANGVMEWVSPMLEVA